MEGQAQAGLGIFLFLYLAVMVLFIASGWIIFKKAGKPGWAVLIPIYNIIVLLEILNKPIWWIILLLIPFVNFIVSLLLLHRLAQSFGKEIGFTLGLIFFPFIFVPVLAFSSAEYNKLPE